MLSLPADVPGTHGPALSLCGPSPLPRRPTGPDARSRPEAAAGARGHWLPPPGHLRPWHRLGPLLLHPALIPAPLSGGGHLVLPSRALGFAWGRGRAGGEAAPAATLPWQVSLPGACGQPSMGTCPLTFQSRSGPPCPASPDAEHKALRPLPRHARRSQGSCLLLPWPESAASGQPEGRTDLPTAPLLTVGPCGCAPPWWPPPAMTLEAPPGHQWTQRGSRDTPPPPPNPVALPSLRDPVDSAGGCPCVPGSEAGVLRLKDRSGSASCQVLGSVGRAATATPPTLHPHPCEARGGWWTSR